jgi:hypothetical protein
VDNLLLETADQMLLETGDAILLEQQAATYDAAVQILLMGVGG